MTPEQALLVRCWEISPAGYDEIEDAVQRVSEGRAPLGWGRICARACEDANVHAGVAIAIAMHETGLWRYGGHDPIFSADPTFHNFGGIKTSDGTATHHFATDALGVLGLVAHLAWYVHTSHVAAFCDQLHDPRHFSYGHTARLGLVRDLGRGVWNTSDGYAANIARHLAALVG